MTQNKKSEIFGITGGSGSGKSYVANIFKTFGAYVIDVDRLGHSVLENEAHDDVMAQFGTTQRKDLGKIVFNDSDRLQALNSIMHSHITKRVYLQVANALHNRIIVIDAAILTTLNLHLICDTIIFVKSDKLSRINRIVERDGITREMAAKRIESQRIFAPKGSIVIQNG
ncbi:MAG: dephospho-CoA kinase [Defluviitaleaceae bacterium]|nr:dephospho-CoA kinase [Defluviitaleaceae bacterium]